jgi:hypothetical protein
LGKLWHFALEFVRYKYSFYEYLYRFMREAQQTPNIQTAKKMWPAYPWYKTFRTAKRKGLKRYPFLP